MTVSTTNNWYAQIMRIPTYKCYIVLYKIH